MNSDFLEQLHDPAIYPVKGDRVEVLQTHLSIVCLVGNRAYKIKKPIKLDFVDYSTLELRKHFCREEVRLNRRLCPRVYRGVVPLCRLEDGRIRVGEVPVESPEVVDYAVEMDRLPEERMLNRLLGENRVTMEQIREVAVQIADFHRDAERGPSISEAGHPEKLSRFALANFEGTRNSTADIFHAALHARLEELVKRDFERLLPVLKRRGREGKIMEGHGDLHARNICLANPIAVYDCIEFNREFRCSDTALENAFLVMDLKFRGHPELAAAYLDTYVAASKDTEQRELMPPLIQYRAMVRSKVSAIAAGEAELSGEEHRDSLNAARRYFHFSAASAIEELGPWIIIACGLPGSGKSFTCDALGGETGWRVLSSDRIRKKLAGAPPHVLLEESFYSEAFSDRTYREMIDRGVAEAKQNGVVLLDANFRTRKLRQLVAGAAKHEGLRLGIVLVDTPEPVVLERLRAREDQDREASDADITVYRKLKSEFERPSPGEADRCVVLDGIATPTRSVPEVLSGLIGEADSD